jgi:hypothetical protein
LKVYLKVVQKAAMKVAEKDKRSVVLKVYGKAVLKDE